MVHLTSDFSLKSSTRNDLKACEGQWKQRPWGPCGVTWQMPFCLTSFSVKPPSADLAGQASYALCFSASIQLHWTRSMLFVWDLNTVCNPYFPCVFYEPSQPSAVRFLSIHNIFIIVAITVSQQGYLCLQLLFPVFCMWNLYESHHNTQETNEQLLKGCRSQYSRTPKRSQASCSR